MTVRTERFSGSERESNRERAAISRAYDDWPIGVWPIGVATSRLPAPATAESASSGQVCIALCIASATCKALTPRGFRLLKETKTPLSEPG
jgi:hypothetical protein